MCVIYLGFWSCLSYVLSIYQRGIRWISALWNRTRPGPTISHPRRSGPLPEASAWASSTWKVPQRPPWRSCCRGSTREVRLEISSAVVWPLEPRSPGAGPSHVFPSSQRAYTTAGPTPMETCGTRSWGRSWNASCARVMMVTKTANASSAPPSTRASILWNQLESAVRRVQVIRRNSGWRRCEWGATSRTPLICLFFFSLFREQSGGKPDSVLPWL